MKYLPEERAKELALYIIETGATVRQTAVRFGISKSTVHTDITTRLEKNEPDLYEKVRIVLETNKEERHIRGGEATRRKFGKRNPERGTAGKSTENDKLLPAE